MTSTPLTRSEAKELTRRRLLRAALRILDEEGEAGLTTGKVSRAAGIAQSSFYSHFRDKDDLLRSLWYESGGRLLRSVHEARVAARKEPGDKERHRDTFRIPLEAFVRYPELFRLTLRARHDPGSPLHDFAMESRRTSRATLVRDLVAIGFPETTEADRRQVEMIADGLSALTESMALGHLEGRYPDLEECVDVLMAFSRGYLSLLPRRADS
ncbi:AcrR family transcriptional regulator [Thermocatellispora tengchongensis]|uniref:AcrR family transcriptional regulator n=2 Tax=Thermocatellispora tengchongensis TaxID=1073253 RepID=A0A840NXG7_9ACTN|nr:TetR family transcriptional regulator [Thermocatellispora tengchongensis]MBB5132208.1 AcrR family transcriptional regulator [Thermocatellispora tengchongensis]